MENTMRWRKSTYSGKEHCVEVGRGPDAVGVRDTKDREAGTLRFTATTWTSFVANLKSGRFDH